MLVIFKCKKLSIFEVRKSSAINLHIAEFFKIINYCYILENLKTYLKCI